MKIQDSLEQRRTYYAINNNLPTDEETVISLIQKLTVLVPDSFNMKSSRVAVVFGENHEKLWDNIYNVFEGKVPRAKIDSFRAGAGTILYFYDENTVKGLQEQFPPYAANFPVWANQSSGMLQLSIWSGLRELGIGASLQHYNPVIDKMVHETLGLPESFHLVAEMPFGGISAEPEAKEKEDISKRVFVIR